MRVRFLLIAYSYMLPPSIDPLQVVIKNSSTFPEIIKLNNFLDVFIRSSNVLKLFSAQASQMSSLFEGFSLRAKHAASCCNLSKHWLRWLQKGIGKICHLHTWAWDILKGLPKSTIVFPTLLFSYLLEYFTILFCAIGLQNFIKIWIGSLYRKVS